MTDLILYFLIGIGIHVVLFYLVLKKKYLRWPDGIILAAITSGFLYIVNFFFWMLLVLFFIGSSLLTHYKKKEKESVQIVFDKGGERDGFQVLANSIGLLFFSFWQFLNHGIQSEINLTFLMGGSIFIAVVNADTWATEIGTLSKKKTRFILSPWKQVPRGTSGGITLLGTAAAFSGSLLISGFAGLYVWITNINYSFFFFNEYDLLLLVLMITIFGFFGQILDSILGATIQSMFECPKCMKIVESSFHTSCGVKTNFKKGYKHFNNDLVNLTSGLVLSLTGILIFMLLFIN